MHLSKKSLGIVAAISLVWLIVLAGMVATTASQDPRLARAGALEHTVGAFDRQGLNLAAVSVADIYGEEWIAGAFACPRQTPEAIGAQLDIDPTELDLLGDRDVPDDTNYLILRSMDGEVALDPIDRSIVDLCATPLGGYFNTYDMLPVAKTQDGGWMLIV